MKIVRNECVGCPPEIGCFGSSCPKINVEHFCCDFCGEEDVTLYYYDGCEICADCLLRQYEIVEGSDE